MRTRYRKTGWLCAALAAVLCLALALPKKNSFARIFIDENRLGQLKVSKENLNRDEWTDLPDLDQIQVEVYLYQLAVMNQYGEYELTDAFSKLAAKLPDTAVNMEELNKTVFETTAEQWEMTANAAAKALGLLLSYDTEEGADAQTPDAKDSGKAKKEVLKPALLDDAGLKALPCYYQAEKPAGTPRETILAGDDEYCFVDQGLYLVWAKPLLTEEYEYVFSPYLVSVPDNAYGREENAESDAWIYEVTVGLKPERRERRLDLEIDKTLLNYQPDSGEAMFVFEVTAEKEITENGVTSTKIVYNDVVGLSFGESGQKTLRIKNIPAGSKVTVREIYTGSVYELVSRQVIPSQGITLGWAETAEGVIINRLTGTAGWTGSKMTDDTDNELVGRAAFTNNSAEVEGPKGDGIVNRFTRTEGNWTGVQITTNQEGGAANE